MIVIQDTLWKLIPHELLSPWDVWSLGFLCFLNNSYKMRLGHNLSKNATIEKNKIDVHCTLDRKSCLFLAIVIEF